MPDLTQTKGYNTDGGIVQDLPSIDRVSDIRLGKNPELDAWIYHFLTENNIEYLLNPSIVASPEQLRFMVALEDDQVYLPCADAFFFLIYREKGAELSEEYLKSWRFVFSFVQDCNMSEEERARIIAYCRYRFNLFFAERMVLPSRMIKRLLAIVLTQCGAPDHFHEKKKKENRRAAAFFSDLQFLNVLHACPNFDNICETIPHLRWKLYSLEMRRLLVLSTMDDLWKGAASAKDASDDIAVNTPACGTLESFFGQEETRRKKVLYIPDVAGSFMFDLAFIQNLMRQGHQVMLALKGAFYFDSPTIWDMESEDVLSPLLERNDVILTRDESVSKNDLLQMLRENQLVIISDGLTEQLNLYRASVTFARVWKECDVVIAKGKRNRALFLGSSHEFTRDIICCWRDNDNSFHLECKRRAAHVRQFSENELLTLARSIIQKMRTARDEGKTVMFYSAVIGSIPGQTRVAVRLVKAYVNHLRNRLDNTLIINPAEYFEEGMDGDDLMYMWEKVQRSGMLDVWRFQTVEDIDNAFALLGEKVPAAWTGKDATFSTGCTKEMCIAIDIQKKHPELQIIGPPPESFFRRRDYGVGKYFDATLKG